MPTPGLTIPQLLVAIVVVIALSSLVISRVVANKRARYTEVMKQELLRFAAAESAYVAAHGSYAADTTALALRPAPKVTIAIEGARGGAGWSATARHAFVGGRKCVIASDTAILAGAKTPPGKPVCEDEER